MAKQVKSNSRFKPLSSNTKTTTGVSKPNNVSTKNMGQIVKGQGYKAPGSTIKPTPTPKVKTPTKPVSQTTPRNRAGISKGNAPGVANKYANKTPLEKKPVVESKPRTRAGVSKGNAPGTTAKYANKTPINKVSKFGKVGKVAGKLAGKAAGAATLVEIGSMVYNDINERAKAMYKRVKDKEAKAAAKAKADKIKKTTPVKTLIETPSLKDELKKRGVTTPKKGDELKYDINKPKGDTKKSDTKVETKKPATTPKASTPAVKKAEPVGTLAPKSTTEIANKSLEEAKTITPAKTTTPAATSTSSESSTSTTTSSPKVTGVQPRASFINRVRGIINESRERRAGRAASRGNEERSERLKEKISETEKKMMMQKGGSVKKSKKK